MPYLNWKVGKLILREGQIFQVLNPADRWRQGFKLIVGTVQETQFGQSANFGWKITELVIIDTQFL